MRLPIMTRLVSATLLLTVLIAGTLSYHHYRSLYTELEDKFGLTLEHLALTAALDLDEKAHRKVRSSDSPEFRAIAARLRRVQRANDLNPENLYTFHVVNESQLKFAVMLHPKPFTGDMYRVPEHIRPVVRRAIAGTSARTGVYEDDHGQWISAFVPIKSKNGRVSSLLVADYNVKKFFLELRVKTRMLIMQAGFLALFGIALMIFIAVKIAGPIRQVTTAARKIEEGDYNVNLKDGRRDEVGDLSRIFNSMARSLDEKFHLLKYISPHTRGMIEMLRSGSISEEGESRHVVVFFSDIRGFTAYSENRNPREVVAMLNRLLGLQSEIIRKHGGSIDKYVGDEIVAVFEGPESAERAVAAAREIQKAMTTGVRRNEELSVGIGLSTGDVVFGNIGSSFRKDYTLIGSNVNLASRLCSSAKGGEILMSSDMERQLRGSGLPAPGPQPGGELKLKGFSLPVHVFSLT